jgi:hypothetical protein
MVVAAVSEPLRRHDRREGCSQIKSGDDGQASIASSSTAAALF